MDIYIDSIRSRYSKLPGCIMKTFPVWDHSNELDVLRTNCFPYIHNKDMMEQVDLWGYIPRISLTFNKAVRWGKASLDNIIDYEDPTELFSIQNTTELVHIVPDANFDDDWSRIFGSTYIAAGVYKKYHDKSADRLQTLLFDYGQHKVAKGVSVMVGQLFELYCLDYLRKGGSFSLKNLETNIIEENLSFGDRKEIEFQNFFEIPLDNGEKSNFNIPISASYNAIDAFVVEGYDDTGVDWFLNATTNVKYNAIMDNSAGTGGLYRLNESLAGRRTVEVNDKVKK